MYSVTFKAYNESPSLCVKVDSFIQAISIAPLQVHYYSEALPTQHGDCVGVPKCHRELRVKVPTWRLERDSNPWTKGDESANEPHATFVMYSVAFKA